LADDLGWGDLAVYGNPRVETPNLDGPASEGVLLTQFCMMSPDCSPSRAAIRTGRNPAELGIHYAIGAQAVDTLNNPDWLDADLATIYGVTRGAGY
jgi:arylsulfatase A-like enzyme